MLHGIIEKATFWKEPVSQQIAFIPLHGGFLFLHAILLVAYTIFALVSWVNAPTVETFSSQEASIFGPLSLNVTVQCPSCVLHTKKSKFWSVTHSYPPEFDQCADEGTKVTNDEVTTLATLCRTTDNIQDPTGIKVWLGNMTAHGPRATVIVSQSTDTAHPLQVTTPIEAWHEKTLLLGMTVTRDKDDCTSAAQCSLKRELYLASMQYDGKVDWGDFVGDSWAGGQLHVRMIRFAHVYTQVPKQSIPDVFASIGGAHGLLVSILAWPVLIATFLGRYLRKDGKGAGPNSLAVETADS
eukprot:TRINITY_DN24817_c0_g1_i1.p1 TRINITY_DN24817_c0_g1~~TRINITY_DN24817_c0_g1_i1.p1  ORF type:complete len:297 (-),score=27.95 TRINITY_DN24817_c0_g1_i1:380-1270(-)